MDDYAHCAGLVRRRDRDRYLCDLFAPEAARPHLFALHAFDIETGRIRDSVSEPTLGEIRLQWWRDALSGAAGGHPVATALTATIAKCRLPDEAFSAFLEARAFDLYDDPMPDQATLEGYAGETASALFQMAVMALAPETYAEAATASGHAGVALTITRVLKRLAVAPAAAQAFLPADLIGKHGLDRGALANGDLTPGLVEALRDFRQAARRHLGLAEAAASRLGTSPRAAFLPLALVRPTLDRMDRFETEPFGKGFELSPWRRQWLIWRAARRR